MNAVELLICVNNRFLSCAVSSSPYMLFKLIDWPANLCKKPMAETAYIGFDVYACNINMT